jgi:sulfur-oxidizing protein SoxX
MRKTVFVLSAVAATVLAGCAVQMSSADYDKITADVVKASFQDRGIAKVDRLNQDETMRVCSDADVAGQPLDEKAAKALEAAALNTIKWPNDGKFLGDWKEGEKIAQSGRGLTWTDDAKVVNGGNCYNCHQLTQEVEYTWGKIWNPHAYNACSIMPRAGHNGVLNEQQIKHLMALLLDPKSPVNK